MNLNEHWDNIFENTKDEKLGWYENNVNQTLKFFDFIDDFKDLTIFITGAGTSLLVDNFVGKTKELILNDISKKALEKLDKEPEVSRVIIPSHKGKTKTTVKMISPDDV